MKYELWYSPSEKTAVLLPESDRSFSHLKAADAAVIWSVEADSDQEASQKRDAYFESEWPDFTPVNCSDTTRFTYAEYLDGGGEKRSLTAPGWVGMVQPLIDEGAEVSAVFGQMYVERPGAHAPFDMGEFLTQVAALGIEELTVVDLRSINGMERMCQEFYGNIEGQERIISMIRHRLGPEASNWRIVDVIAVRGPGRGETIERDTAP